MSSLETRIALYARIHGTQGWSRDSVLLLVKPYMGEPPVREFDDEGNTLHFSFRPETAPSDQGITDLLEEQRSYTRPDWRNPEWFIRHSIIHSRNGYVQYHSDIQKIQDEIRLLETKFKGLSIGPFELSVTVWWNGGDEPIPDLPVQV